MYLLHQYEIMRLILIIVITSIIHYINTFSTLNVVINDKLSNKLNEIIASNGLVLIDGDNVRGKTGFKWSKQMLYDKLIDLIHISNNTMRVVLFYDHGNKQSAYLLSNESNHCNNNIVIGFSGPRMTVDDVISRDITWLQTNLRSDVLVITEDNELKKRCRKNSVDSSNYIRLQKKKVKNNNISEILIDKKLSIINSKSFVDMLSNLPNSNITNNYDNTQKVVFIDDINNQSQIIDNDNDNTTHRSNNNIDYLLSELIKKQTEIQQQIDIIKFTLTKATSRKIKLKLNSKILSQQKKMDSVMKTYERITNCQIGDDLIRSKDTHNNTIINDKIDKSDYNLVNEGMKLFKRVLKSNTSINKINLNGNEETWERIILAEKFRRDIINYINENISNVNEVSALIHNDTDLNTYVNYINSFDEYKSKR